MATIPRQVTLTNSSVDILNAIRNSASQNYRDYVPIATPDSDSIREIGAIIMDYPSLQNEFLSALVNRVGRVVITSKMYSNPLTMFKKGLLEFGESIEEIFVNIAKPFTYDPSVAEEKVFKREIPDVRSAFHVMNYQKYYKSTVQNEQLRQAFLSWDGITNLISKIVESMYTAANYDEFQVTKYLLARHILNGRIRGINIPSISAANMKTIVSSVKATSNELEFLSSKYNVAGVMNATNKADQFIIMSTEFDAIMDVEVLASAFNMDKAQFIGNRVLVDGFGKIDNDRLAVLFEDDPTYVEITDDELSALNTIPCVIVDRDFFMIFDNLITFTEQYNGEGLYWNYWYHAWKTFSVSPFAQSALFVPDVQGITSVTVTPDTATVTAGHSIQLSATVVATNFAPKTVKWEITDGDAVVSDTGVVTVDEDATSADTITVKVSSTFDTSKYDECTITVA